MSIWKPISSLAVVSILALALASCSPAYLTSSAVTAGNQAQALVDVVQAKSAAGAAVPQAQTGAPTATGGITVVGTGVVSAAPTVAQMTVGIETTDADVKKAVDDNNTQMTKLLDSLKGAGVAASDIRTTNFSIYADRQPSSDPAAKVTTLYHVQNQVEVTVRDLKKVSDILDIAVASGANTIYGVNYSISDQSKLQDEARTKAVADAKARAEKLAQLEGLTLGSVVSVQEVTNFAQPMYAAADMGRGGGAPIESGSLQVSLSVQVTYAIK